MSDFAYISAFVVQATIKDETEASLLIEVIRSQLTMMGMCPILVSEYLECVLHFWRIRGW